MAVVAVVAVEWDILSQVQHEKCISGRNRAFVIVLSCSTLKLLMVRLDRKVFHEVIKEKKPISNYCTTAISPSDKYLFLLFLPPIED